MNLESFGIEPDKMVCTFCGKKPIVGFTFVVDGTPDGDGFTLNDLDEKSLVAVCKDHLGILQEQMEQYGLEAGSEAESDE